MVLYFQYHLYRQFHPCLLFLLWVQKDQTLPEYPVFLEDRKGLYLLFLLRDPKDQKVQKDLAGTF
jgi:hypothetical protein